MKLMLVVCILFAVSMVEESYAADAPSDSLLTDAPTLAASGDTLSAQGGGKETGGIGNRIIKKSASGALWGTLFGAGLGAGLGTRGGGDLSAIGPIFGVVLGYPLGTAVGVTRVDSQDRFILTLTGSLVGAVVGISAFPRDFRFQRWSEICLFFAGPVIGSTAMSELWRKFPETRRVSIDLVPDTRGFSAVTTLRF